MKELSKTEKLTYLLSYYLNFPLVKPRFVNFGLTHRCNLRCKICETWEENPKIEEELTLPELKRVILELARWGDINVSFAGGEPLIRKEDLLECLKYANEMNLTTHVTTNGTFITKKVAEELIDSGLDYLQISLDGMTRETNDSIRDKGSYKGAMRAIKNVLNAKESNGSSLNLSLTTVITGKNLDELLDIYEFVKKNGLHEVTFNPYNLDTSYVKDKSYADDEFWVREEDIRKLRKICKKLTKLKEKEGRIGTPLFSLKLMPEYFERKRNFNTGICLAGYTYMYVNPYGFVDVCGKGPSLNVRDHSIKRIWYSPTFAKSRLQMRGCKRPCLMVCFPRIRGPKC